MPTKNKAKEVFDCVKNKLLPSLSDIVDVHRGKYNGKDRPVGACWPCDKFADESFTHESPSTAKCCKGCDAYRGETT